MPQMMPMMWLIIFLLSLISLNFLIQHLFFFFNPNIKNNKNSFKLSKFFWNWKW